MHVHAATRRLCPTGAQQWAARRAPGRRPRFASAAAVPPPAAGNCYNFAPASPLDDTVCGCCMPGFADPLPAHVDLAVALPGWAAYMRAQGVTRVVVLLGEDELQGLFPAPPGLLAAYEAEGFVAVHESARAPGACGRIARLLAAAADGAPGAGRVVVHCTGGCHRVGTVLSGWIAQRHGLDPTDAAQLMASHAGEQSVAREAPSPERLEMYLSGIGW